MSPSKWLTMGQASKIMGLTPKGARQKLLRIQKDQPVRFMRRFGRNWEVNYELLRQINECPTGYIDNQLFTVREEMIKLDSRVTALRNVNKRFRRSAEKRFSEHDRKLTALKQLAEAANAVVESFGE
jgi:hypothetical protein